MDVRACHDVVERRAASARTNQNRYIHWNSDVVVNSGPAPYLVIGSDGTVTTAVNVTVNGVRDPPPGTLGGTGPIEVDDLVNTNSGDVLMQSASGTIDGGSCVGGSGSPPCTGTVPGTTTSCDITQTGQLCAGPHCWGTFTWRDNWSGVTIWRASFFPDCGSFRILTRKGSVNCQRNTGFIHRSSVRKPPGWSRRLHVRSLT
ncbi:MAG: hypothetical protein ACRDOK_22150 [Streptosporangiaceae bacterium]